MQSTKPGETSQIQRDLACVACGYNLRTLHESAACPECGYAVAGTLKADLTRADLPALKGMRDVVDTLAGLPLTVLASSIPVLIFMVVPIVSPWALIGLPTGTGGVCLFLYMIYGRTFLKSALAYLPRQATQYAPVIGNTAIAVVALLVLFAAIAARSGFLAISIVVFGGSVFVVMCVVHFARRLAVRTQRADIVRLASATIIFGCIAEIAVLLLSLYFVRTTRELVAPVVGTLSVLGLTGRNVFIVAPVCIGVFLALASLVMFRLRGVLDTLIAEAARPHATPSSQ